MNYLVLEWSGDQTIATWTAQGGNKPSGGDQRGAENMFDADDQTIWHAFIPADSSVDSGVTIEFKEAIVFHKLVITARPQTVNQSRFREVCLFLNGESTDCTSKDRVTSSSEKIEFKSNVAVDNVTKVELRFGVKSPVLADLVIFYLPGESEGEYTVFV